MRTAVQSLTSSLNAAVYGTLLSEEILNILLHRVPDMSLATVKGFRRHRIQGRVYPAIIPAEGGAEVQGMVLSGLSEPEFAVLDEYEDEDYYRTVTTAQLQDGKHIETEIYVWVESKRDLLYGTWDYQDFRKKHLSEYMAMCQDFGAEFTSKDMVL
eukprot:jgi/Astpho2/2543/e_gw1.00048.241.1_t